MQSFGKPKLKRRLARLAPLLQGPANALIFALARDIQPGNKTERWRILLLKSLTKKPRERQGNSTQRTCGNFEKMNEHEQPY